MDIVNEKEFLIRLGKRVKLLRKQKGFTQQQLANDLNIEISQISRIERGVISTSVVNLYAISLVLGVDVKEFFNL